jgi:hypothetical protein
LESALSQYGPYDYDGEQGPYKYPEYIPVGVFPYLTYILSLETDLPKHWKLHTAVPSALYKVKVPL